MKRIAIIMAVCFLLAGGCTEGQLDRGDAIAADVNSVGQAIGQVADGPVGDLLPPGVRQIMQLLGIGAVAAFGVWQKIRGDLAKQDTKGVIASVDTLLISDQVSNTKKAVDLLKEDQGPALVARVRTIKAT